MVGDCMTNTAFQYFERFLSSEKYEVVNLGAASTTMVKQTKYGKTPYWVTPQYQQAIAKTPNIVVIHLGTNDSKNGVWDEPLFVASYIEMVKIFQNLKSKPQVYLAIPPPWFKCNHSHELEDYNPIVKNEVLPKLIPQIAAQTSVPTDHVINLFALLGGADPS